MREHYENLCESDGRIRVFQRQIEVAEKTIFDRKNQIACAKAAIRLREAGLMGQAYRLVRKEAGINCIPGFRTPHEEADALRKAAYDKEQETRRVAREALSR